MRGKRQVARADHDGDQEIAQHRGNRRDQEEEDHDDPVHREQLVVGVVVENTVRARADSTRMPTANAPPTKKNAVIENRYSSAMRLWSVVNSHDFQP